MRFGAGSIAGLCNGSTPDSDSVCEGSNPSPAATKKATFVYLTNVAFFERSVPLPRNVKYASQVKRTACVKCAFGTTGGGTLHFTLCQAQYFTAASPLLHLAKPNFTIPQGFLSHLPSGKYFTWNKKPAFSSAKKTVRWTAF